ncbi:MAG: hypothetical protein AB7V15_10205, partial [Acidimicrobiia bacterium]
MVRAGALVSSAVPDLDADLDPAPAGLDDDADPVRSADGIEAVAARMGRDERLAHLERIPARPARYRALARPLP